MSSTTRIRDALITTAVIGALSGAWLLAMCVPAATRRYAVGCFSSFESIVAIVAIIISGLVISRIALGMRNGWSVIIPLGLAMPIAGYACFVLSYYWLISIDHPWPPWLSPWRSIVSSLPDFLTATWYIDVPLGIGSGWILSRMHALQTYAASTDDRDRSASPA